MPQAISEISRLRVPSAQPTCFQKNPLRVIELLSFTVVGQMALGFKCVMLKDEPER